MGYIQCSKCGGTAGTMVKVGDSGYAHQREQDCSIERAQVRQQHKRSQLVIGRPKIVLPKGGR